MASALERSEFRDNLRLEYEIVATHMQSNVNQRFITLGAFIALNVLFVTAYGFVVANPQVFINLYLLGKILLCGISIAAALSSIAFLLIEARIAQALGISTRRARYIEHALAIPDGIFSQQLAERVRRRAKLILPHYITLVLFYGVGAAFWLTTLLIAVWSPPHTGSESATKTVNIITTQELETRMKGLESRMTHELTKHATSIRKDMSRTTRLLTALEHAIREQDTHSRRPTRNR